MKKNNLIDKSKSIRLDNLSKSLRKTILDMVNSARRGHIPSAFSCLEIVRVLYDDFLRYRAKNSRWEGRDRFILSKGNGCLAQYVILAEKGFFPKGQLSKFCKFDGILGGHPQYGKVSGIEASTGSLGHGLSIGLGMALSAERMGKKYKSVVVISDGECNEGSTWEALLCARKYKLTDLIILVDYKKRQSYGSTFEAQDLEPFRA